MAIIYPNNHIVLRKSFSGKVNGFIDELNDFLEYEDYIIIKPFVNGDEPDMVVIQKNKGITLFQFCGYSVEDIETKGKVWNLKEKKMRSPFSHLFKTKENFFNIYIPGLLEMKINNSKLWWIIKLVVVMENDSSDVIKNFIEFKGEPPFVLKNFKVLSKESFEDKLLSRKVLTSNDNLFFTEEVYQQFIKYLAPQKHIFHQGKNIKFNLKQKDILESDNIEMIVKGVVGSGKTTLLAAKAVNIQKRTNGKILILCYNITLINLIKKRLNDVYEDFDFNDFHITNYHGVINTFFSANGVEFKIPKDIQNYQLSLFLEEKYYSNYQLFENLKDYIKQYDAILVDEVQDYKYEWLEIVKNYFLKNGGYFYLFGDEKQNVYNHDLDKDTKDLRLNIDKRKTRKLTESVRLTPKITHLTKEYQKKYFSEKYFIDDDLTSHSKIDFGFIQYHKIAITKKDELLVEVINQLLGIDGTLLKDETTVLGSNIDSLREIESFFRIKSSSKTQAMFETSEIYLKSLYDINKTQFEMQEAYSFFPANMQLDKKLNNLVRMKVLFDFKIKTKDKTVYENLEKILQKFDVKLTRFEKWHNHEKTLISHKLWLKDYRFTSALKNIRDNKKINFDQDRNKILFSTIHSYKGYENNSIIMLVEPKYHPEEKSSFEEIIYTGLTRAKENLIIFNFGNDEFDNFMKNL